MRYALPLFLLVLLVPLASAATLTGAVYDAQLDVLTNSVITIDTQPQQRLVSTDGTYTFDVPEGNYTITVRAPLRGNMTSTERVVVDTPGTYQFDLFFFPSVDEDEAFLDELDTVETLPELSGQPSSSAIVLRLLVVALLVVAGIGLFVLLRRRSAMVVDEFFDGPNELDAVVKQIKAAGGRITQKELRKKLPESEAKVSLMIAELESQGRLKKIKKGRGNLLVLKKNTKQ